MESTFAKIIIQFLQWVEKKADVLPIIHVNLEGIFCFQLLLMEAVVRASHPFTSTTAS